MYYVMSFMILALSVACLYLLKEYKETLEKLNNPDYKKEFEIKTERFELINLCVQCSIYEINDFIQFASSNSLAKMLYTTFIEEQILDKFNAEVIYVDGRPSEYIRVKLYGVKRRNKDEKNDI